MPLLHKYNSPLMGIWKINETWQEMFDMLQNKTIYEQKLETVTSDSRKQELLSVRLLLKEITGEEMQVYYQENGAPFLPDKSCHISISHTKGFAAVILDEKKDTGIDIEYRSDRAWKLRERYLSEEEVLLVDTSKSPKDLAAICWCAKETAFKTMREDGVDFIKHIHIFPFEYSENGTLKIQETRTAKKEMLDINFQITNDYILTWIK